MIQVYVSVAIILLPNYKMESAFARIVLKSIFPNLEIVKAVFSHKVMSLKVYRIAPF
jgi:hypothetical protein